MSRILHQARRMSAARERFKNYLWYSVGEIVLVVVGILIALQVNSWNENRIEQRQVRAYAIALASDLREDIAVVDVSSYQAHNVVFQIDELVKYLQGRPFNRITNADLYRYTRSLGYRPFAFNRAALDPMKSSGALREVKNRNLARKIAEYEGLTLHLEQDQSSDIRNAHEAFLATNKVIDRNIPDRTAVEDYFDEASTKRNFDQALLDFPSTEIYQRMVQNDHGLIATSMREVQEMTNVLISYASDLSPRPGSELPRLMARAKKIIELIEAEYPEK